LDTHHWAHSIHSEQEGKVSTDQSIKTEKTSALTKEYPNDGKYRILCLDGGGAKGFYTLGVLKEIESMLGCPLYKRFDLIFGTSTGSIIASLLALGYEVDAIHGLYKKHVPSVMSASSPREKSAELARLAEYVYGIKTFADVLTGIGIVTTKWVAERPMIFKGDIAQAHGRLSTFQVGFGVSIADAVQASCSAYPFFDRKIVTTAAGDNVELIDGGYSANNPTLYAIADAIVAMKKERSNLRVISIGVGVYPEPKPKGLKMWFAKKYFVSVQLLQKTLEINTQSMDQLRAILFKDVATIRISDTFERPEMATDLMEHDLVKLNVLRQRGSESFASREQDLKSFLM
jgi:predicted acylesterase/phospholipase RssA